jgi:seryl-tRNA synthetase
MMKKTNKKITIDDLAGMMLKGFNELGDRIDAVDVKVDKVEIKVNEMKEELVKIRGDINNTKDHFVPYHKFDALNLRVTNIENKGKSKVRK